MHRRGPTGDHGCHCPLALAAFRRAEDEIYKAAQAGGDPHLEDLNLRRVMRRFRVCREQLAQMLK
jgi:hypothetical protein